MKRLLTLLIMLAATASWSQKLPRIKGSGTLEVMDVALTEAFHAIALDGDMDVELVQGEDNGYSIETDDNLIEVVDFSVVDSTLYVSLNHRITKKKKFLITIKTTDISRIELKNEVNLESNKTLTGESLTIIAGMSSKYELDLAFEEGVQVDMYSNAEGILKTKSKLSTVKLDDRASLKMYGVVDSLSIDITDNTNMDLDGTVRAATLALKESSKLMAKEASLAQVEIALSHSTDAFVNAKETITLHAQDTSVLQLYGDPEITVTGLKNKAKVLKRE